MRASEKDVREAIHLAMFPMEVRDKALAIVLTGLSNYRSGAVRRFYSHTGKLVKKPTSAHEAPQGRHDQTLARTVLISALCRAWVIGIGKPTLNHKSDPDSDFFRFAQSIMAKEGIGRIHEHLEIYWSTRKNTAEQSMGSKKKANFRGE